MNPKTIAKWRKRASVADRKTGPAPKSTVVCLQQEAVVAAFRRHTLLPLDDCLYAVQATIPELTRSSLHRCLQRHDIDEKLHGGQSITVQAPIDQIPLFVKAGSILPLGAPVESTHEKQPLEKIKIYPGTNADFTLYNDDGTTYDYEKG